MSESIARRVARLVSGSLNGLVDAMENVAPEVVMDQTVREIDSAIEETRAELGQQVAQKHLASKRLMEENSRHEQLAQQIEVAVAQGRDDLAEAGIAEQMDVEARMPVLESSIADCAAREKELEGFVQALLSKKRDMQTELKAFKKAKAEANNIGAPLASGNPTSLESKVRKADKAFERVMENSSGLPGRGTDIGNARKLSELEELNRKNRISERLAAIKASK